jgi:GDPmannose 4,6-dehydratase
MFGSTAPPQNEDTLFHPRSPYAVAKVAGYYTTINYREAYNLHACNAISFNHESSRRGETFVTRKITRAATRIKMGLQDKLYLGNLEAQRDWSHAADVADAMYKIITAPSAGDYVIASGEMRSVREFAELVFSKLDMDYKKYVEFDPRYLRPSEVDALCGDSSKLRKELGWAPKYTFDDLVNEMIESDLKLARQERILKDNPQ